MRLLFVTMSWPLHGGANMYSDLISEFTDRNNYVDVIALSEKRNGIKTHIEKENNLRVAYVKCGNIQKVNKYSKVLNSFLSGFGMLHAANSFYKKSTYDTILFALPPLTIAPFIVHLKKQFKTKLYLLLKEFWPQDPADLGAMRIGGLVWSVFRKIEILLYKNSDFIGTMSEAGIDFLRKNNPFLSAHLEVCPNSQKVICLNHGDRVGIRRKYNIPINDTVYVFGGNFGVSQGIDEMIKCIDTCNEIDNITFLLIGNGTEYKKVENEFKNNKVVRMMPFLPRDEFDNILSSCDVGLIFLNPLYTVPNIPSRMISYLLAGLPIIAAVDHATDAGDIIEEAGCGIKTINGDSKAFKEAVLFMKNQNVRKIMSSNCFSLMTNQYSTEIAFQTIIKHF